MLYIAYTAAALFMVMGIVIIFTDLFPSTNNFGGVEVKIVFGVVMFLYGTYRLVIITFKRRADNENTE